MAGRTRASGERTGAGDVPCYRQPMLKATSFDIFELCWLTESNINTVATEF